VERRHEREDHERDRLNRSQHRAIEIGIVILGVLLVLWLARTT